MGGRFMNTEFDRATILVVDDIPENIDILRELLKNKYKIKAAVNGETALKIVTGQNPPDLILLDIMMPHMDGYEVCQTIKEDRTTKDIPIIFVTANTETEEEVKGFEVGAVDYITKPIKALTVLSRVETHLALAQQKYHLKKMVKKRTIELEENRYEIIKRLSVAAEFNDTDTGTHIARVSEYAALIAKNAGLDSELVEIIRNAAPMHDVGKIGIPDIILRKTGKLNREEWEMMERHCEIGADIIGEQESLLLKVARNVALTHHERWNGTGYPKGLQGEQIPIEGRIIAIADVFDALTSERTYKNAWSIADAVELIKSERGKQLDEKLCDVFVDSLDEVIKIREHHVDGE